MQTLSALLKEKLTMFDSIIISSFLLAINGQFEIAYSEIEARNGVYIELWYMIEEGTFTYQQSLGSL